MVNCSTEVFLLGSNNNMFAFSVVNLDAAFETKAFEWSRNCLPSYQTQSLILETIQIGDVGVGRQRLSCKSGIV